MTLMQLKFKWDALEMQWKFNWNSIEMQLIPLWLSQSILYRRECGKTGLYFRCEPVTSPICTRSSGQSLFPSIPKTKRKKQSRTKAGKKKKIARWNGLAKKNETATPVPFVLIVNTSALFGVKCARISNPPGYFLFRQGDWRRNVMLQRACHL